MTAIDAAIPPTLTANWDYIDRSYPTWVSQDAAFSSSGELVEGLFHPALLDVIQQIQSRPVDPHTGCVEMGAFYQSWVNPPDRPTIEKAARNSGPILTGRVSAKDFGFDRGTPGQLFLVEPEENLKGDAVPARVYFFMPIGTFRVGDTMVCKEDSRYPAPPTIGDEVLLMLPETFDPSDEFLDLQYESSLIVLPVQGPPRLPAIFKRSSS